MRTLGRATPLNQVKFSIENDTIQEVSVRIRKSSVVWRRGMALNDWLQRRGACASAHVFGITRFQWTNAWWPCETGVLSQEAHNDSIVHRTSCCDGVHLIQCAYEALPQVPWPTPSPPPAIPATLADGSAPQVLRASHLCTPFIRRSNHR